MPHIGVGETIEADAPMEVAMISRIAPNLSTYVVSGVDTLAAFDLPANSEVAHEVVIRLTSGTSDYVIVGTASTPLGFVLLDGSLPRPITGVGLREVCVHYADRSSGACQ